MGDHFVLLVDRLITESTLEAAIESRKQAKLGSLAASATDPKAKFGPRKSSGSGKLVECRICQDEDEDRSMEIPCSCCGSLKYAHRKCVQRWCNEKGDTVCEICLQQFKPGYTSPPKLFCYGRIPMNFRGNWEISRHETHNQQFMTMIQSDRDFMGSSSDDDYASLSARATTYCRLVAVLLMVILVLRNAVPMLVGGADQYSLALFILLLLRTAGIVLPLYATLRAVTTFRLRLLRQDANESAIPTSEGEDAAAQA